MLDDKIEKRLNVIINYIMSTEEYKNCIKIKEQMKNNSDITDLINKIKKLQKLYIRKNSEEIKLELDKNNERLSSIPIYNEYINNLEKVNEMIDLINDELNNYFYQKIND